MPKGNTKEDIRDALISNLDTLINQHLPAAHTDSDGWRVGNLEGGKGESLSISKEGLWQDFSTGEKGDIFDLFARFNGLDTTGDGFIEVLKVAAKHVGLPAPEHRAVTSPRVTINTPAKNDTGAPQNASSDTRGVRTTSNAASAPSDAVSVQNEREAEGNTAPEPAAESDRPEWLVTLLEQAQAALKDGQSKEAEAARAYLKQRGITTLKHFGVADGSVEAPEHFKPRYRRSMSGRLLIIYRDEQGHLDYYNARDVTGKAGKEYKYLKPAGESMRVPFNPLALTQAEEQGQPLLLTEGELDAVAVMEALGPTYPVLGCSGGNLPKGWHERIATSGVEVIILADNDAPGAEKARTLNEEITKHNARARLLTITLEPHKDASAALEQLGRRGLATALTDAIQAAKLARISDHAYVTGRMLEELDARADRKHAHYSTGLTHLDKLLDGGYVEGLHLLGGVTGGGKTSLALSIAVHNALAGRHVLYVSYEQSKLELWGRIANRIIGTPRPAIKSGWHELAPPDGERRRTSESIKHHEERWQRLQDVARCLLIAQGGDALSRQQGAWSIEGLAEVATDIADAQGAPPLIIVDYLQRVPVPDSLGIKDIRERVGAVAGKLQTELGRDLNAPVLALSSVNRTSYNAQAFLKLPAEERLTAFKESGELEYTSYTALLLYNLPDTKRVGDMQPGMDSLKGRPTFVPRVVDLLKNREGTTERLAAQWKPWADEWSNDMRYDDIGK